MKIHDLAIVGGGAAGLMAASWITDQYRGSNNAPSVLLLEKMPRCGRKINITGRGRCNLTNTRMWDEFSPHIHPNNQFFKNAFYNFSSADTMDYFKSIGLELTVERGQRVYPKSMRAMDVTDSLVGHIRRGGIVEIKTSSPVERITKVTGPEDSPSAGLFEIQYAQEDIQEFQSVYARRILVTTGGLSYPSTGSSGDGYRFAKDFGHSVTECRPSLCALTPIGYKEKDGALTQFGKSLNGLQLKNISLSLEVSGNIVQEEFGDADFTDGGIEGSLGFRLSRRAVAALDSGQKVALIMDLKPSLSKDQIAARITREASGGNNTVKFLLSKLLPRQLITPFLTLNRQLLQMPNKEAANLLPALLKSLRFNITSYVGFERCVVTNGGVSLKEVSQKTMESKLIEGLYFAGEVLDLDGDTGGYNLQIAFSTAVLAVRNAMSEAL